MGGDYLNTASHNANTAVQRLHNQYPQQHKQTHFKMGHFLSEFTRFRYLSGQYQYNFQRCHLFVGKICWVRDIDNDDSSIKSADVFCGWAAVIILRDKKQRCRPYALIRAYYYPYMGLLSLSSHTATCTVHTFLPVPP